MRVFTNAELGAMIGELRDEHVALMSRVDKLEMRGLPGVPVSINIEIEKMWSQGNRISAIKLYKSLTGIGLQEAKDALDSYFKSK